MNRTNIFFSRIIVFIAAVCSLVCGCTSGGAQETPLPKNTPQITPAPVPTEAVSEFPTCTAPAITDAPNHDTDSETVLTAEQISAMNAAFLQFPGESAGLFDLASFKNGISAERLKALQAAMAKIEKDFGKGSIMKLGDESVEDVDTIPTGSLSLDAALGVGGYPKGRIIEIFGPESSGKTTLALHAIAEAQKAGGLAAFIDAEHALDRFYAAKLGVNTDDLLISQPDNGEQALEIADQLIRSSAIDIIVIDSVAALTPKAEIEGDMGDNKVGLQARLMSQALRKLTSSISKTNTTCIFINQLREKIGIMFGNPETTTGGNALKFYASVRLDIRRVTTLKDGDTPIGNQVRVKIVKNKVAPPFRKAEFEITFGEGISRAGEIVDLGVELGILKKSGSWFSYGETRLGQGRDAVKKLIKDNPELSEEIEAQIAEALKDKHE